MTQDEREIRQLVATWMAATKAGDAATVLSLIAEDAVFLTPGRPPMRKADFAQAVASQVHAQAPEIDGNSDIQELQVSGDWAFMWSRLNVTITPPGGERILRSGHTLTVFKKENGRWLLARDANLLS